ncbi:MAG: dTDP-4-dehydrorhamnose reductase [Chloroflexota bacterium]|nr:dTDP-4-dehydrorhamnose reductase [Chloroflexota bacterium]
MCRLAGHEVTALTRADHDITDLEATRRRVIESDAEVIFNAAAYTAVDRAESEPELAMTINGTAPGVIAAAAAETGALLVHFSTDYVFDGSARAPIPEDAPAAPLGVYGRTKLAGEEAVRAVGARALVVRTAWVYGLRGNNFITTVLRVSRAQGRMKVVDDQRGSPTWARDLAVGALRLADVGRAGTYHLTNGGSCTWYELACEVVKLAGIEATITPITTAEYPTPARRPAYSVLDNRHWHELGEPPLRDWKSAVAEFMRELPGVEA